MNIADLKETLAHHRGVVFLCAAIFINSVGTGVIAPVLPLFANQEFQINHTQVGLVVGLHGMGRIFVSLPAGYFTQRYGRRFMLIWGTTVNLAGAAMVSISFNYTWLVLWRMVSGMGSSMYTTVVSVYLQDVATPENRARFLSLHEISILAGQIIGPAAGGVIGQQMGLRVPLYLQAILIFASLVLAALFIPETRSRSGQSPAGRPPRLSRRRSGSSPSGGWRSLLLNPGFTFVGLFALMIVANRQGGRFSIMPLFGEAKGFGANQLGAFISVTHFPQFFTTIAAGFLSDRFGRKFTILPATILIVLGIVVFVLGNTFLLLLVSGVLLGLGEGLAGPPWRSLPIYPHREWRGSQWAYSGPSVGWDPWWGPC